MAGVWRGFEGRALKGNLVGVAEELRSLVVAELWRGGGWRVWRRRRARIGVNSSNGEVLSRDLCRR